MTTSYNFSTINWCKTKGVKLISPNENLREEYLDSAKETLKEIKKTKSNIWLATQIYYFNYFLAYSVLMKIGIKSEIHECTIEIIKFLEHKKVLSDFHNKLVKTKSNSKPILSEKY